MATSFSDAFKEAQAKQGKELPLSVSTSRNPQPVPANNQLKSQPAKQPPSENDNWKSGVKELKPNAQTLRRPAKTSASKHKAQKTIKKPQRVQPVVHGIVLSDFVQKKPEISQPVQPNKTQQIDTDLPEANDSNKNTAKPAPPPQPWTLTIAPDAMVHSFLSEKPHENQLIIHGHNGIAEQPKASDESDDVRELVIGLDFGTSSVKVVIGDRSAGTAFAVQFFDATGIDSYLLPSRLWETSGQYSLESGAQVHRNLKLSLLASGDTSESYRRATAFLALVLRHARAWLFTQHAEIYNRTKIVWKLVLGMPAENYADTLLVERFHLLARSAWMLAGCCHKKISAAIVDQIISRVKQLEAANAEFEAMAIEVVPEISAQIYGFLKSNQFDPQGRNIFVMVDVGAGTVDSALFHVQRDRGGIWNFKFYTNHVLPNGVMNLHRTRIDWWTQALQEQPAPATNLLDALRRSEMPTDQLGTIPERLEDYVSGVAVKFNNGKMHPDALFFKEVWNQVRGKTIYRAWDGYTGENGERGFLTRADLQDIPLFLCGGGSRLNFYHRLEEKLRCFPGCPWLSAQPRNLVVPYGLEAPGLIPMDYDRLSVAYGLSFLDVGKIAKAFPPPVAPPPQEPTWHFTDRFIDKDQV